MKCLLKDRKGREIKTKCGREEKVVMEEVTVWWTDVTCPHCLALMRESESSNAS